MIKKILISLLVFLLSAVTYLLDDIRLIGSLYFYLITFFLIYDIIRIRKLKLIHVWLFAVLFIIISEINTSSRIFNDAITLEATRFLMVANNLVFLGNFFSRRKFNNHLIRHNHLTVKKSGLFLLIALIVVYVIFMYDYAITAFFLGRVEAGNNFNQWVLKAIIGSLGYVLPATLAYLFIKYNPKYIYVGIVLSLPIWIILFMVGTRFPLLFSFLGFVVVWISSQQKIVLKHYVLLVVSIAGLFLSAAVMKVIRGGERSEGKEIFVLEDGTSDIPVIVGNLMTNEDVVKMTAELIEYYKYNPHEHKLGASSSFITYFWIPRSLWPEKPEMLGYWFYRKANASTHSQFSAAFGYTGDLFVDFGYFSLLFMPFLGMMLNFLQSKFEFYMKSNSEWIIVGAMFYPTIFFFVRSPVTALMNLIGMIVIFILIKNVVFQIKQDNISDMHS